MLPRPPSVVDEVFARHALFNTDAMPLGDDEPQDDPQEVVLYNEEGAKVRVEYPMETHYYLGPKGQEWLNFIRYYVGHAHEKRLAMERYFNEDGSLSHKKYYDGKRGQEYRVR